MYHLTGMKYPLVLFYRHPRYASIDTFIHEHREALHCTIAISNSLEDINKLYDFTYYLLVTYGDTTDEYAGEISPHMVPRLNRRWVHYTPQQFSIPEHIKEFNEGVNYCYIHNVLADRESTRPTFSIMTTTFKSYEKIQRAYQSLKQQTMKDWEWVIVDDTNDEAEGDAHFQYLRKHLANKNNKVRLYRRHVHSGSIGNVKNESVSLCRGKYVIEMDHDDELTPDCLQNAVDVFESNPKIGFVYMDFFNIYENGEPFWYSDFISLGYGGYYLQKCKTIVGEKWMYVYVTPNVNDITAHALICLPNHPRIWRRDVLLKVGNYSEMLPICDDMEVLLRTLADDDVQIAKICKVGYIQYMNHGNNNFSLIRNAEINRIGPEYIYPMFYKNFNMIEKMKQRNAKEPDRYWRHTAPLWKRPGDYRQNYANILVNPDYDLQICILGTRSFYDNIARIKHIYHTCPRTDFILLEINLPPPRLCELLDLYGLPKIKCYSLQESSAEELIQYFHELYRSCDKYEIWNHSSKVVDFTHRSNPMPNIFVTRHDIINYFTTPFDRYLEIGVETGYTYQRVHFIQKTGVDPVVQIEDPTILATTSDRFFANNTQIYNAIFIDGMHQTEYVARDIQNAFRWLAPNGRVFLDDIFPKNEEEQLRIPIKHKLIDLENALIAPDGVAWTGDVWKVMYFMLKHLTHVFDMRWVDYKYFRGVSVMQLKPDANYDAIVFDIDEINEYTYQTDFANYKELLYAWLI